MQLRQSQLAEQALLCLERVKHLEYFAEYGTRANSFPSMVVQVGLAQALGFLRAKSGANNSRLERAYRQYYEDLVTLARIPMPNAPSDGDAFYSWVVALELGDYRRATQAILDGGVWLKRIYQGTEKPARGVNK